MDCCEGRGCYRLSMFTTKTFTPFLVPAALMLLVSLTSCRDEDYKRTEASKKNERLENKAERLEDKAQRHEEKAQQQEQKAGELQHKADQTRDTTHPIENEIDEIEREA